MSSSYAPGARARPVRTELHVHGRAWKPGKLTKRRGEGTCGMCLLRVDRLPRAACREAGPRGGHELRKAEGWTWTGHPNQGDRLNLGWVCPECSLRLASKSAPVNRLPVRRRARE